MSHITTPDILLSVEDLICRIAALAHPVEVLNASRDAGSAQTGYCFSSVPHTVVLAADRRWFDMAYENAHVSCVITSPRIAEHIDRTNKPIIVYDAASEAFHYLHNSSIHLDTYRKPITPDNIAIASTAKVHPTAVLEPPVTIGDGVTVGPYTVITGPVKIGEHTNIAQQCTIGSNGLFAKQIDGTLIPFSYYGGVTIGHGCQIHARANIARAPHFGCNTCVGHEVAIGISSNIGHDCVIDSKATVASTATICGRARVGTESWIGAGAIVSDGVTVGANARVRIGAVVIQDIPDNSDVSGNFAQPHSTTLRQYLKGRFA